jgi:dipeptidyl aminopeptidase/acylaminoacyl peptidase
MTAAVVRPAAVVVEPGVETFDCGSWGPSLAPDGTRMVFVSDRDGLPRAWLGRDEITATPLPTGDEPVVGVAWSPDGAWIACEIAPAGAPRHELWLIRPDGAGLHQVGGYGRATCLTAGWVEVQGVSYVAATEIADEWQAVLIEPESGVWTTLLRAEMMAVLDVSRDGRWALFRGGPRSLRHLEILDLREGRRRRLPAKAGAAGSTERASFSPDSKVVYARTDVDGELARLVAIPVRGGASRTLAERADAELEDFAVDVQGNTLALLWNVAGRSELTLFDPKRRTEHPIDPQPGEIVAGVGFARGGRVMAFCVEGPGSPRSIWRVRVVGAEAAPIDQPRVRADVVRPALHRFAAADGLEITGWWYRPAGHGPFPTMISLHGGPEAQERPGHHPLYERLTDAGIAIFAPNVRGSAGFGRSFINADNGALRHAAITDVRDCVSYLTGAGLCDPARIGVMGRSYGGYLTLAALVTFPELFALGAPTCGMSDLLTFFEHTEPWIASAAVSKYGDPERDTDLLRELSPLHRIDRLRVPLLVTHGENDTNVPLNESEQLVRALRERGMPHEYLLLRGEGHDFLRQENRELFIETSAAFIASHLAEHVHHAVPEPAREGVDEAR